MCLHAVWTTCPPYIHCRMLIPMTELGRFDSMVMPFELEAYDILKSRSCKHRMHLTSLPWYFVVVVVYLSSFTRLNSKLWQNKKQERIFQVRLKKMKSFFLARSPALRSPRSGTPRRHLITPIPGTWAVSLALALSLSRPRSFLQPFSLSAWWLL